MYTITDRKFGQHQKFGQSGFIVLPLSNRNGMIAPSYTQYEKHGIRCARARKECVQGRNFQVDRTCGVIEHLVGDSRFADGGQRLGVTNLRLQPQTP
jgi:hypothetical protein